MLTKQEAIENLREVLPDGATVYCILRSRSKSGMSRVIEFYAIQNNEPRWIGYWAAVATGKTYSDDKHGIRVNGCGMDMGWHFVVEFIGHAIGRNLKSSWL